MVGVLGTVTSPIRPGGTGEMIYSQDGTRRAAAARSEDGEADPEGRRSGGHAYEKGIAYVRRWEELTGRPAKATELRSPWHGQHKYS